MRGIALTDDGVQVVDYLPEPQPGASDLLIRVLAVGLCGTDVTLASGRRAVPFTPWVLGHESVGQVVAVGESVNGWWPGDIAVLEPNLPDLDCAVCGRGLTSACDHRGSAGVKTQPGFLAERVVHPAEFCHKAPERTPLEDLVCVEPMAVARSAVRRSGIEPGARALVLGAGAQGLFLTQILTSMGVEAWVTDVAADRQALAVRHGARPLTPDADPFGYVFDAAGVPAALRGVLLQVATGAVVTVIGESSEPLPLSSFDMVQRQLTLRGSFIYDHPVDFQSTLKTVVEGRVHPSAMLAEPLSWEGAAAWLRHPFGAGKAWLDLRGPDDRR